MMRGLFYVFLGSFLYSAHALTCNDEELKVTVKVTDPSLFDEYEQYLFKGTLAYAIRKFCSLPEKPTDCNAGSVDMTDTVNVHILQTSNRFAMCIAVNDSTLTLMEDSFRYSRDRFDGGLELNEDTLVVNGVDPTLKPDSEPAFPIWLIPFIVITCLVVLAAVAILGYTVYQTKRTPKHIDEASLADSDEFGVDSNVYVDDNDMGAARTAL
uniref:Collectrin n=1 Tax=Phallusia mammillata TaxID=59560 RepID=A0A6F9DVP9_9ASCI|nr:collectrin [Phallusia mammillata]